jgi:hypothetical protein
MLTSKCRPAARSSTWVGLCSEPPLPILITLLAASYRILSGSPPMKDSLRRSIAISLIQGF